jgi:hypothetical protein
MSKELRINVAYSDVLVYDLNFEVQFPNNNIVELRDNVSFFEKENNIEFPYQITPTTEQHDPELIGKFNQFHINRFSKYFEDLESVHFEMWELDEILISGAPFIYPLIIDDNRLFESLTSINIDERVVKAAHEGIAKIVFIQPNEAYFAQRDENLMWVSRLSEKYNLSKDSLYFITGNLLAEEKYLRLVENNITKDNFSILSYNFFKNNLWFLTNEQKNIDYARKEFTEFLDSNKKNQKEYHFLSFNRMIKPHRLGIFSELLTNEKFRDKSIVSLGSIKNAEHSEIKDFDKILSAILSESYHHGYDRLINFLSEYNSHNEYNYDENDLYENLAFNLNVNAHNKSFVNIVTESYIDSDSIFFSEKVWKPIYCAQPFILFGNPHSLKKLKEHGFKTFNKWWDESYDDELDFTKRFSKIIDVMLEISSWDNNKLAEITGEMEGVLMHNFELMMDKKDAEYIIRTISP